MQKLTIPYEILFRFGLNDQKDGGVIKGAHYKNLTIIMDEGESVSEKEGPALDISAADTVFMEQALGALNTAVIGELNEVKAQLNNAMEEGRSLFEKHNDLVAEHNTLSQQNTQTLAELDGTRINLEKANADLEALHESESVLLAANSEADQQIVTLQRELADRIALHDADIEKANKTILAGTEWTNNAIIQISNLEAQVDALTKALSMKEGADQQQLQDTEVEKAES